MPKNIDIKALRTEYGMSQEYLAGRLGVSRPTLIKVEKGERLLSKPEEDRVRELFGLVETHHVRVPQDAMRIAVPQKKLEKFKEVLLYVLGKTAGKPNVGMTALYKLLYFIDFDYYEKYEQQLMGLTYFRNHYGPAPREFMKVVEEMKKDGTLEEVKSSYFAYEQRKFLPHKNADLSKLSAQEIAMVDNVLARYGDLTATQLMELSHEDTPWFAAEEGKDILYEHVFYRPEKLSVRQYEEL